MIQHSTLSNQTLISSGEFVRSRGDENSPSSSFIPHLREGRSQSFLQRKWRGIKRIETLLYYQAYDGALKNVVAPGSPHGEPEMECHDPAAARRSIEGNSHFSVS